MRLPSLLLAAAFAATGVTGVTGVQAQAVADGRSGSVVWATSPAARLALVPADTPVAAISYSDAYGTRLVIHRIGSYAILPLFGAQYLLGRSLMNDVPRREWVKPAHVGTAVALGTVFAVNTTTGAWNLWESRRDPEGRTRRYVHAALMTAAQAGFVYTATLAGDAGYSRDNMREHRNAALVSVSLATVGTVFMWIWND